MKDLQDCFKDGLEDKCKVGAANVSIVTSLSTTICELFRTAPQAAASALSTSDEFAASMHWSTYRASESARTSVKHLLTTYNSSPPARNMAQRSQCGINQPIHKKYCPFLG